MIYNFLSPIIGWLILFGSGYFIYNVFFNKSKSDQVVVDIPGQHTFAFVSGFFWVVVYMCLSSIWSIAYTLIDLKFPDIVNAPSDYGTSLSLSGALYDAMAFPLATLVVSAVTALGLAWWVIRKQKSNPDLRPDTLYKFIKFITFIGGGILAFSGFVYVVYSWLYGSLPVAIFLKGLVALLIVGSVATYFYLVAGDTRNPRESTIGKFFSAYLFIAMVVTLVVSFNVVGTPAQARLYRLDALKISDLREIKDYIDSEDAYSDKRLSSLSSISDNRINIILKRNNFSSSLTEKQYTLCADFVMDMPKAVNDNYSNDTWNYKKGNHCFTFDRLTPVMQQNKEQIDVNQPETDFMPVTY